MVAFFAVVFLAAVRGVVFLAGAAAFLATAFFAVVFLAGAAAFLAAAFFAVVFLAAVRVVVFLAGAAAFFAVVFLAAGRRVRVLAAGKSDVPLVRVASQHIYGWLLRRGVRVFEMRDRTLHAKTATIDGVYAMVGSFNLDFWSHRRLLEVSVTVIGPDVAAALENQFRADLAHSTEVTLEQWQARSWLERLAGWCAYQLVRL